MPSCKVCKNQYANSFTLRRHMETQHSNEDSDGEEEEDEEEFEFMNTEDEVEIIGYEIKKALDTVNQNILDVEDTDPDVNPASVEDITGDEVTYMEVFNKFRDQVRTCKACQILRLEIY